MDETVGQRIQAARLNAGLTQQQVADRLGVKVLTVSYWERDQRKPRWQVMSDLSKLLGVPVDLFLMGEIARVEGGAMVIEKVSSLHKTPLQEVAQRLQTTPRKGLDTNGNGKHEDVREPHTEGVATERVTGEVMPVRGRGGGRYESWLQLLPAQEAAEALKWLRKQMKDMPREADVWPALQKLSRALGQLCAPQYREVHPGAEREGADSDEARMLPGEGVEARDGRFREQTLASIPPDVDRPK